MRAPAILFALLVAACSPLVGEDFRSLTTIGGPPREVINLPDGTRVYRWRDATCELAVTMDAADVSTSAEFAGADCARLKARFGVE